MSLYICLTAEEWRNLCATGRIRVLASRAVADTGEGKVPFDDELFALAPDRFALSNSSDFIIAECIALRDRIEGTLAPAHKYGVRWLALEDVVVFSPVRVDDAWAFEADAEKAQIRLGQSRFEELWKTWVIAHTAEHASINGLKLVRAVGLMDDSDVTNEGSAAWASVAAAALAPNSTSFCDYDVTTALLVAREKLFELVREDADSAAIFVACPVEWISLRSGGNILDSNPEIAARAIPLNEKYRGIPFAPDVVLASDIVDFLTALLEQYPWAFSAAWTPSTAAIYVRYFHRLRFGKPTPHEVIEAIRVSEISGGRGPARMLAFLLGVALDSSRTLVVDQMLRREQFSSTTTALPTINAPGHDGNFDPAL